jgi:tRNA pseudouridine38-40 synthase
MKILLRIRYDGGAYCGFQAQPNGTSVQSVLTEAFSRLFGFPCNVTGCSRTDSGVHALGFCAAVEPKDETLRGENWCSVPVGKIHRAVNVLLPDDIAVNAAAEVPDDFHPRYNVVRKTYEYHILRSPARDPFLHGRVFHAPRPITEEGVALMRRTAEIFVGKHDFSGYMAVGSKITDATRTVYAAEVEEKDDMLLYRVSADGFLYNMVRIMAGTLLDCAWERKNEDSIRQALLSGDRSKAGFTAPPEGLFLCRVHYEREINWECL